MKITYHLNEFNGHKPTILTLGNFDGMHLGHQSVIKKVVEEAKANQFESAVISFVNHPAEILKPELVIKKICTLQQKIQLIEKMDVDHLILLTFTKEFSEQSAEDFLKNLRGYVPYSQLILGWDASFGKYREGSKEIIKQIADKEGFKLEYVDQFRLEDLSISSSEVRKAIMEGHFDKVERMIGRPYSILSHVNQGEGKGKRIGFPTANINVQGLVVPPYGVYAVKAVVNGHLYDGIANLGVAPTLHQNRESVLEVHLFDFNEDIYGKQIEVFFKKFIRPEKKFSGVEELKAQIQKDVMVAKA